MLSFVKMDSLKDSVKDIDFESIVPTYNDINLSQLPLQTAKNIVDPLTIEDELSLSKTNFFKDTSKLQSLSQFNESTILKINGFQGNLEGHPSGNNMTNLSFSKILEWCLDESNIKCEGTDKCESRIKNDTFYVCSPCGKTLCSSCKAKHEKEYKSIEEIRHYFKEYKESSIRCFPHKEKYIYYCIKCRENLCKICKKNHCKDHEKDIIVLSNSCQDYIKIIEKGKKYIKEYIDQINFFIKMFKNSRDNFESLLSLTEMKIKNFEQKNLNYNLVKSIENIGNSMKKKGEFKEVFTFVERSRIREKLPYLTEICDKLYKNRTIEFISQNNTLSDFKELNEEKQHEEYDDIEGNREKEKYNRNNSLVLKYKTDEAKYNKIRIFGKIFCQKNRDKCYISTEKDLILPLTEYLDISNQKIKNNIIEITLHERNWTLVQDMSCMFGSYQADTNFSCKDPNYQYENIPLISIENPKPNFIGEKRGWDTSEVIDMSRLFTNCNQLESLDAIENWKTKNVESMSYMFYNIKLEKLPDLSNWNTENVKDFSYMFGNCENVSTLNFISKWDTSSALYMEGMFYCCKSLKNLPEKISLWEISQVVNMERMFYCCMSLEAFPLINVNQIIRVENMREMFCLCYNLKSPPGDMEAWNTASLEDFSGIWEGCNFEPKPTITLKKKKNLERKNAIKVEKNS